MGDLESGTNCALGKYRGTVFLGCPRAFPQLVRLSYPVGQSGTFKSLKRFLKRKRCLQTLLRKETAWRKCFLFLCFISGPSYSHSLGGGVTRLRFCPIFTLIISLTAGSTSPFPHLFSIVRENKCLVRSGYEFVTILHLGSR